MLKWRQGNPPPEVLGSLYGTAVVHKDSVYVSRHFDVYWYRVAQDEWEQLPDSQYQSFSLAVLDNQPTTIGGISRDQTRTNCLFSLVGSRSGKNWEELYPPIPTHRVCAAALTTPTHLVVAGGRDKAELCSIEVMNRENFQWSKAVDLPAPMGDLQMTLCFGQLYICSQQAFYSHSLETFLQSCYRTPDDSTPNGWSRLPDIPTFSGHCLSSIGEQVLAVGGSNANDRETAAVHGYDHASSKWTAVGEMPTARVDPLALAVVLEAGEVVVVVGGWSNSGSYNTTDIASLL